MVTAGPVTGSAVKARAIQMSAIANDDSSTTQSTAISDSTEIVPSPTNEADITKPTAVKILEESDRELASMYRVEVEYWQEGSSVTFNATIIGGPSSNRLMHCQSQKWQFGDGMARVEKPDCFPFAEGDRFQRTWLVAHKYAEPGSYQVRFNYGKLYSDIIAIQIEG